MKKNAEKHSAASLRLPGRAIPGMPRCPPRDFIVNVVNSFLLPLFVLLPSLLKPTILDCCQ